MAALTAAILGVTGCYGQTDLATNSGPTSATLNARGTANSGPVVPYFEYWKTATPRAKLQTPIRIIAPGATPRSPEKVTSLDDQTAYSFRLCGIDQSTRGRPVCAQTRSFITGSASVQVFGSTQPAPPGEDSNADIDVNVASGAPGRSPLGGSSLGGITAGPVARSAESCSKSGSRTTDNITCLNVEGSVAVVGYRQIPRIPTTCVQERAARAGGRRRTVRLRARSLLCQSDVRGRGPQRLHDPVRRESRTHPLQGRGLAQQRRGEPA